MIKYINIYKEESPKTDKHPTHKIVVVHENGDKQYIGSCWYSDDKGRGSIKFSDGVELQISDEIKSYPAKKDDSKPSAPKTERHRVDNLDMIDYGDAIKPEDIPF